MALLDYTTYEDIRAALGVSDDELEDVTLGLESYATGVSEELYAVDPTLLAVYEGIAGKDVTDRTEEERRVYALTRQFATCAAAKQLGASLPMFGPKSLSDGKATMSRFSDGPYRDTLLGVTEQYGLVRGRLISALGILSSVTAAPVLRPLFSSVGAAYDPLVG